MVASHLLPRYLVSAVMLLSAKRRGSSLYVNARLSDNQVVVAHEVDGHRVLEENFVGLYLVKIEDDDSHDDNDTPYAANARPGSGGDRHQTSNIELPDGTIYEVINAQVGWDGDLTSGSDEIIIPAGSVISSDGDINVKGKKLSKVVYSNRKKSEFFHRRQLLQDDEEDEEEDDDDDDDHYFERTSERKLNLATLSQHSSSSNSRKLQKGTRSVLAVRVLLNDVSYNFASQNGLSNDIFGNGIDSVNLKSQYAACSYNQLKFDKASNRNMRFNPKDGCTDIRNGVVDIKVNRNLFDIPREKRSQRIRNAVTRKINSVFGVSSPNRLANHVMYCYPPGVMSGIAYAYMRSWNSNYNGAWCNYVSTQMHEIGHNLGYAHSGENHDPKDPTYGDRTGMMGFSYEEDNTIMCFNGAKSWASGWYSPKTRVIQVGSSSYEGNLYGIADYNNTNAAVVLIKINDRTASDIYVTYNRKSGINSETKEGGNQVTVTRQGGEGIIGGYETSLLLAKLGTGMRWIGVISGKTMIVTVTSIDTSFRYARVRIATSTSLTAKPSPYPTDYPTYSPNTDTDWPTYNPSESPITSKPSSRKPTSRPTSVPTSTLTKKPTTKTKKPTTKTPTSIPSSIPTLKPSRRPSSEPSYSSFPSTLPTTTSYPSTTSLPTSSAPTFTPSSAPTSLKPSSFPTSRKPTSTPSSAPTSLKPSSFPTSRKPTSSPSSSPTTRRPSSSPTSHKPTSTPSSSSTSRKPTRKPTTKPTTSPTLSPTYVPVTFNTPACSPTGNLRVRKCLRQNGNMFSIDAIVDITITSITVSNSNGAGMELWSKQGNYTGSETNRVAWTKVGVAVSNSSRMKSMLLPVNINMNSGSRRSFYITTNVTTSYVLYGGNFTGTPSQIVQETGTSIQNNHIFINMGTANKYPFGKVIAPRYFNGAVTYKKR